MAVPYEVFDKFWSMVGKSDEKRIASQTPTPGVAKRLDIPYVDDGRREHLLDVYRPEQAEGALPLIVDIHGGGWLYGYKEINTNYNLYLSSKGFTVVSINYRLGPEAPIYEQVRDVFEALAFIEKNAGDFGADLGNAFLCGDSAGGQLAAIACAVMARPDLQAIYGVTAPGFSFRAAGIVCGAYDVEFILRLPAAKHYAEAILGKDFKTSRFRTLVNMSDILKVDTDLPPIWMSSSQEDFIGFLSIRFDKLLTKLGKEHTFRRYGRSKEHALPHVFNVTNPEYRESMDANDRMLAYFRNHMR